MCNQIKKITSYLLGYYQNSKGSKRALGPKKWWGYLVCMNRKQ